MTAMLTWYVERAPTDVCDRCGALATLRVEFLVTGFDLLFCGHHARRHRPKLDLLDVWLEESPAS